MDKKIVFDFDETIITQNSFPKWVLFILKRSLMRFDISLFLTVTVLLFRRKILNNISHQDFKKRIITLDIPSDYSISFSKELLLLANEKVVKFLNDYKKENFSIAISSAAPENYLIEFFKQNFDSIPLTIIGSTVENGFLIDNYQAKKVENLIKIDFLKESEKIEVLFTDSEDDVELAKLANKIYLVKPSQKAKHFYLSHFSNRVEMLE